MYVCTALYLLVQYVCTSIRVYNQIDIREVFITWGALQVLAPVDTLQHERKGMMARRVAERLAQDGKGPTAYRSIDVTD